MKLPNEEFFGVFEVSEICETHTTLKMADGVISEPLKIPNFFIYDGNTYGFDDGDLIVVHMTEDKILFTITVPLGGDEVDVTTMNIDDDGRLVVYPN